MLVGRVLSHHAQTHTRCLTSVPGGVKHGTGWSVSCLAHSLSTQAVCVKITGSQWGVAGAGNPGGGQGRRGACSTCTRHELTRTLNLSTGTHLRGHAREPEAAAAQPHSTRVAAARPVAAGRARVCLRGRCTTATQHGTTWKTGGDECAILKERG